MTVDCAMLCCFLQSGSSHHGKLGSCRVGCVLELYRVLTPVISPGITAIALIASRESTNFTVLKKKKNSPQAIFTYGSCNVFNLNS